MDFPNFVAVVEATLLSEHDVELRRSRSSPESVLWFVGRLLLRLDVESIQTVALYMSIEDAIVAPVSYPMSLRAARDVAHDLAALIDLPKRTG